MIQHRFEAVQQAFRSAVGNTDRVLARSLLDTIGLFRFVGYHREVLVCAGQVAILNATYQQAVSFFDRAYNLHRQCEDPDLYLGLLQAQLSLGNTSETDRIVEHLSRAFADDVFVSYRMETMLNDFETSVNLRS